MFLGAPETSVYDSFAGAMQFFTLIVIFLIVLGITLVATKWIANYQKSNTAAGNIEVVETFRLTTNKYVQIIKVSDKYLAIAIGRDEVTLLAELSPDDVKTVAAKEFAMPDFAAVLAKFKKSYSDDKDPDKYE
ncbi:MAG: flagellar biosynthetic protein FliO [Lachnospiraceae bacterium]|nr:flagellar biosynthetic protein FliO [Lachnospiraceae bacterium]